jgi:hypothetical protein
MPKCLILLRDDDDDDEDGGGDDDDDQLRLNHDHKIFNNACPSYLKNNVINKLPNITNTIQDQVVLTM